MKEFMLEEYKRKRTFGKTPEPKGEVKKKKDELRFVIQKHQASHLHYDFRLELGGVLKSWAVPKGPSLDPNEKRLAMMVEDHPFDYKDFEGIIPKGNYGAGTVMIWDEGPYHSLGGSRDEDEKILAEGLNKGHITFILDGKKLKGEFALVRLKRAGENAWLLIKAGKDEFVSSKDVLIEDKSVKSGFSLEEISQKAAKKGNYWASESEEIEITAPNRRFPQNVSPMMSTLAREPFDDKEWLFEIKWDGYRAITEIMDSTVRIYSRNNKTFNERFPEITNAFASFHKNAVFDGEIVAVDSEGRPSFQLLQNYLLNKSGTLVYYVFDLLYYEGKDLTGLELVERKRILRSVLPKVPNIQYSEDIKAQGIEFFQAAKEQDLEGIMAKIINSKYEIGKRSKSWLKIKNHVRQEFVIGGFTEPRGTRSEFGSIAVGYFQQGELIYVGNVGTGFNDKLLKELMKRFKPLVVKKSPFVNPPKVPKMTWLKPSLVCEVKFQEWTSENSIRQPVFLGLREDKDPKKVIKEQ